jgi:ABC-2 type transport system permease protein
VATVHTRQAQDSVIASATSHWLLASFSLTRREVVRFLRQRSRVIGALGTPIVFWLVIGSGLNNSFQYVAAAGAVETGNYFRYAFPGTMALIVMFTAIFSTISVIEDRQQGFLQGVVAAPVPRSAIVFGKMLGATVLAVLQAIPFLLLAPLVGISLTPAILAGTLLVLTVLGIALSGLGLLIAWPLESTQGFHAIMNLVLVPMWLLSGAMFPPGGAAKWLTWIMFVNPLTYGVTALRQALYLGDMSGLPAAVPMPVAILVTLAFAALMTILAARVVDKRN